MALLYIPRDLLPIIFQYCDDDVIAAFIQMKYYRDPPIFTCQRINNDNIHYMIRDFRPIRRICNISDKVDTIINMLHNKKVWSNITVYAKNFDLIKYFFNAENKPNLITNLTCNAYFEAESLQPLIHLRTLDCGKNNLYLCRNIENMPELTTIYIHKPIYSSMSFIKRGIKRQGIRLITDSTSDNYLPKSNS